MISTRRLLPLLVALLIWGHLQTASASPSNATPSSPKASAPFSVMIDEAGARKRVENQRGRDPPGSPVNLFTPDEFQFYTLNGDGQLVMKQMTKQEIQGMIAAGGSGLPVDLGHHLTQLPNGEPEVSEVVQNVQKVLKGELNRPVPVHTASSSIPGSINSQWTNMLPYILSGGSVDQQDVVQDTNVILPALESEQPYVDVIPLQNGKPAESQSKPGPYYVPMSTTEEQQENKFITLKPVVTSTEKPIYLLGNMALDSGILGEPDTYSTPTKKRPTRPTTNAVYQKFTTTRPSLDDLNNDLNNIVFNVKNDSDGKPTLYIPLSVSPSLIADAQNQDKYGHLEGIGADKIPNHIIKHQEKNTTKSPNSGISTFGIPLNKAPINVYPDDSGYTRVPMIQVPVISADKISTTTQRTSQQQTPMFEILPTISPGSLTSTTSKQGSHPLKVNLGPIGGFKKPDTTQKTTITYHPVYNPTSKLSTSSTTKLNSVSTTPVTYRPIYQPVNKLSTTKLASSTYRPVYDAITKIDTATVMSSTSRPAYQSTTKESTAKISLTSTYRPVYKPDTNLTTTLTKPINANSPVFETSTSSSEEMKVTWYPANMYTTGKASSPVLELVTKSSTQSEGLNVTKHSNDVKEAYATKKVSSLLTEIVTKPTVQTDNSKVTKYPISAQETTIKNEVFVNVVEQLTDDKKNPVIISTSQNTDNYDETTSPVTESNDKGKTTFNENYKLPERTTLENLYATDNDDYNVYSTTVFNDKEESKVPMTTVDQEAKTESYTTYEDPTIQSIQVDESSTKIITDIDDLSTQHYKMEESTTLGINIPSIVEDKTEKYNDNQLNANDLTEQSSTLSDDMPKTTEPWVENETTIRFVPIKEDTTKYSSTLIPITDTKSTNNKEDSTIVPPKNTESITEYSTSITMAVDPSEKDSFVKKPLNSSEKIIIVLNSLAPQESDDLKNKISTIINEKFNTEITNKFFEEPLVEITTKQSDELDVKATTFAENKYTTKVTGIPIIQSDMTSLKPLNVNLETTTENSTPIYTYVTEEMEEKITTFNYDTTAMLNHSKNLTTVPAILPPSATTENKKESDVTKNTVTPVYEKMETITESIFSIDENTKLYDKNKYSFKEEELSTVKVIPVYDDDASIYNLPSENPSQFTLYTTKLTNGQKPIYEATSTTTESILSTKINPTETALPGLQETFNNYMKEHYETKSTTNSDEVLLLTTFPPAKTEETTTSNIKVLPAATSTISSNADTMKYQTNLQINELITSTPINENKIPSKENNEGSLLTTKPTGLNNKNKIETPIIYLDFTSSNTDKENSVPLSGDNMHNSSMTIIKINNPVSEVEKIIEDAPLPTNTPSTVLYTLPTQSKGPNNIASGLIAGYPTYSQVKPVTESIFSSATPEMVPETKKPNVNVETNTEGSSDETTVINKYTSIYRKPTYAPPEDEDRYASTTSTMIDVRNTETTMSNYSTLKTSNYDSRTEIPTEFSTTNSNTKIPSQPEEKDEINTSFNPPLEKISDLINQLQNSPPNRDSMIGYDYSNGIATTIVPYDKFETIMTEHAPTTTDDTLTTIFENLSKTSLDALNTTYVVLQTLPVNHSTKPIEISTEYTTRRITTKEPTTAALPSQSSTSVKPSTTTGTTTVLSIVKQPTTGKPYITSTYSTTKGSLEKIQSTIDKSAGRINLEEEKTKVQMKPTEASKFTMKNKNHYSTNRRPIEGHQGYTRKPTRPISKGTTATTTKTTTAKSTTIAQYTTSKPIEDSKEANKWTLIPQKGTTDKTSEVKVKEGSQQLNPQIVPLDHSTGAIGLDQSNKALDKDVAEFLSMCNELSFKFWMLVNSDLNPTRSVTMSPFGMISTLAMIFLGARGLTSNQMNDILKLDDVVTFNPHLVFQNITDTVTLSRGQGIENAAFVRALFADRLKVRRIIPFYKEQTQQFYEGAVVDINFSTAGDILRRKTNLLIRKQTGGRIKDFLKQHTVSLKSPLTALSANVFQTSCDPSDASSDGRDGEMYFAVSQTVKQRKLVPIPAVVWKSGVSAGYEPSLDATAVALGDPKRPVSMIMVMPGQQGVTAPGDNLERLEYRLFGNPQDNALEKLLKVIIPRRVEVQMPKFSHRSIVNVTSALKKMGFDQLFTKTADLKGINGAGHDLYLAEMMQMNLFCTCGDDNKLGARHLSETYPGTSTRHSRAWELNNDNINNGVYNLENNEQESTESSDNCEDDTENWSSSDNPREDVDTVDRINNSRQKIQKKGLRWLTPVGRKRCRNRRQVELEKPRMKMDKPFLYLIRHNLSGLILHIGRFNPKNQS